MAHLQMYNRHLPEGAAGEWREAQTEDGADIAL